MIKIFDTTLRDGEQAPGCSMNLSEKLEVARTLDRMRVDVMEAGFAVISKGDFDSVKAVAEMVRQTTVASLARAVKGDIDAAHEALKAAKSPRIHVFLATSPLHMTYKLKMTEDKVIETIRESITYAKSVCQDIEFSAEDAMRSEPVFLAKAVATAIKAGATVINIPDTVGYATPAEMKKMLSYLREHVEGIDKITLSVHCHNDLGLAVANSLAAVEAGATQVECTLNGLGERAGNAALEEIVMGLATRKDFYSDICGVDTTQLYRASKLVYNIIGMTVPINKAIVGTNAFAHEAGIHQHGVLANRETYEIMTPQSIGLTSNKMVLAKHSGRHAIESRLAELGFTLDQQEMDAFFEAFKALADKKKEITDYDLEALVGSQLTQSQCGYQLDRFTINSGNYVASNAVVRLIYGEELLEEVALGDGPIDAAFNAIDKIMNAPEHALEDYAIHSISEGKDALGEVMVKIKCNDAIYSGRGLSTDILEASILAYVNGLNKLIGGGQGQ